jgi:hypothetical protein
MWAVVAVPILIFVWSVAMIKLFLGLMGAGLMVAANGGQGALEVEAHRAAYVADVQFLVTAVVGLAVIAIVAIVASRGWLRVVAAAFLVLAMVLGLLASLFIRREERRLHPPPPPTSGPTQCMERSGGDTRCPGG